MVQTNRCLVEVEKVLNTYGLKVEKALPVAANKGGPALITADFVCREERLVLWACEGALNKGFETVKREIESGDFRWRMILIPAEFTQRFEEEIKEHLFLVWISAWETGEKCTYNKFFEVFQFELKTIAHNLIRAKNLSTSLQTTELFHELFIKWFNAKKFNSQNIGAAMGCAKNAMAQILVDYSRKYKPKDTIAITPEDEQMLVQKDSDDWRVERNLAMRKLVQVDPVCGAIAKLHLCQGLSMKQIGEVLDLEARALGREWKFCKDFLTRQLRGS